MSPFATQNAIKEKMFLKRFVNNIDFDLFAVEIKRVHQRHKCFQKFAIKKFIK